MLSFDFLSDSGSDSSSGGGGGFAGLLGGLLSGGGRSNKNDSDKGIVGEIFDAIGGMFSHENGDTFEANSKPKLDGLYRSTVNYIENELLVDSSIPMAQRMTKIDALLGLEIYFTEQYARNHGNSAWKQGHMYHSRLLQTLRSKFRKASQNSFTRKSVTRAPIDLGLSNAHNTDIAFYPSVNVQYFEYTAKPVQSGGGSPVQSTVVTTSAADGSVNTYVKPSNSNDDKKSTGLIAGIIGVVVLVIGGIVYLIKKKR